MGALQMVSEYKGDQALRSRDVPVAKAVLHRSRTGSIRAVLYGLMLIPTIAGAALSDEIQVYTDDINAPGEFGLELHINTTPKGRRVPDYPGEVVPNHGLRITPEFSYGLTDTWEAGFYVPTNREASGSFSIAGAKLRLKWLPIRPSEGQSGWFAGANGELSRLEQKFSQSRDSFELRIMNGYRGEAWLFAVNPVFGWNLSRGYRNGAPDLSLQLKAARNVSKTVALGAEYYAELGTTSHILPTSEQSHTLFAVADMEFKGFSLNFGVGRGLTNATDRYTVKSILGFAF
jgi:hypothetical protein